jgi:hypothetical protein
MLIDPAGNIYRCHYELYKGINSYANILDKDVTLLDDFKKCNTCGLCNSCDIKIKNDRFQNFGHCAVEIKRI